MVRFNPILTFRLKFSSHTVSIPKQSPISPNSPILTFSSPQAAKIIANLLVAGGTVLFRAATQAYKQALVNGAKAGMTGPAAQAAARASKGGMPLKEAEMILGIEASSADWEEVLEKYKRLYEANDKTGSFYLLSKVYRAKETIEQEFRAQGKEVWSDDPFQQQQEQQQGGGGDEGTTTPSSNSNSDGTSQRGGDDNNSNKQ